jgi:GntR family transcriptional regulator / MocR family aminotransferase
MTDSWATFGADLHLDLTGTGVRAALERAMRDAVRNGRLAAGTRLPSSRSLARDLGIARNTVADAYGQLVAEGWLTARQGSGTRVGDRPAIIPSAAAEPRPVPASPAVRYDLTPGAPDLSSFPRTAWLAAAKRALTAAPNEAFGYGDPRGRIELRRVLAEYLARARGVRATPDRILVCSGYVQGLALLTTVLREGGAGALAVESVGLDVHRHIVTANGLRTVAVPVDDRGARTAALHDTDAGAALLTPAHQFPTGVPLHPRRRAAAVAWARETGGVIVEDDYDGEFRYDRQPVGALQDLDPEHVVYTGTASKSLAPGLRLAWLVLPPALLDRVVAAKSVADGYTATLEQLVLAELIASGGYDRHVRRCRSRYRSRRDRLVAALAARAPRVRVTGIAAGLHALLELPSGAADEQEVVAHAAAVHGLALCGLSHYRYAEPPEGAPTSLVVGYGTPAEHAFSGALEALCATLETVT